MLIGDEVKVGNDLDHTETVKGLKGEQTTGADPIKKYAQVFITVRSASIIYNKNRENLEIFKEIYTQDAKKIQEKQLEWIIHMTGTMTNPMSVDLRLWMEDRLSI